jgi:hypothetical protein
MYLAHHAVSTGNGNYLPAEKMQHPATFVLFLCCWQLKIFNYFGVGNSGCMFKKVEEIVAGTVRLG